jgi:quinoprotein relay system zinc metallohydrolase 2
MNKETRMKYAPNSLNRRCFLGLGLGLAAALTPRSSFATNGIEEIAPGAFVHQGVNEEISPGNQGHIANCAFVVGDKAVAVIDTGSSAAFGHWFRKKIQEVTNLPIRYVVATHVHPDHLFGHAAFLQDGPAFIGHRRLPAALEQRGAFYLDNLLESLGKLAEGTEVVMPDLLVEDQMEIDLGGRVLTLRAHETAHTDNDLSVLDQKSGVLFAGDLLFMDRCPVLDGSLLGWLNLIDKITEIGAKSVVPGHGPSLAPFPSGFAPQARYLATLRDSVRAFIAENGLLEDAVRALPLESERSNWVLFDETHGRNVNAAYVELEWE